MSAMRSHLNELFRFGLVGVLNSLFGLFCIYSFKFLLAFPDIIANATGYFFGLILSFFLNSRWVFVHDRSEKAAAIRFGIVFLVSYVINAIVMISWIKFCPKYYNYSHVAGFFAYSIVFFILSKFWTFKNHH